MVGGAGHSLFMEEKRENKENLYLVMSNVCSCAVF